MSAARYVIKVFLYQITPQIFADTMSTNVTGTWNTVMVAAPHLVNAGGGSIIIISSAAGLKVQPFMVPYTTSKFAVRGMAKAFAAYLSSQPVLEGIGLAKEVIPDFGRRTILHAGPPIEWTKMCGPMRGAIAGAKADLDFVRLDADAFGRAPNISVDYAVFEKTRLAAVLPVAFAWSDLGSWDAVWKRSAHDSDENATRGPVTLSNTSRSLVVSEAAHIAVEGLDDIAVIASEDAIYVGKLSEAQKVGTMVKALRAVADTSPLTETHRTAYRPWGGYSSVLVGDRFQVKRLFVKPGKRLSLQKHHHRSEHWVVVRGTAEVTIDGKVSMLTENQSVYLPLGCTHRLANPGKIMLELIEVQTGSYLGEDDIIRIEDEFGRA